MPADPRVRVPAVFPDVRLEGAHGPGRRRPEAVMSIRSIRTLFAALALAALAVPSLAQSELVGWGLLRFDSSWSQGPYTRVRAAWANSTGVRPDGSAHAWGINW